MGILDKLKDPEVQARLGLLSSALLRAGAPTTDPGAFHREMGGGLEQMIAYQRQQALDKRKTEMEALQKQNLEMQLAERKQQTEGLNRLREALTPKLSMGQAAAPGTTAGEAWGQGDLGQFALPTERAPVNDMGPSQRTQLFASAFPKEYFNSLLLRQAKAFDPNMKYDPNVDMYYQEGPNGQRHYLKGGLTVEQTPDGISITQGGPIRRGAGGLEKKNKGQVEGALVGFKDELASLRELKSSFRAEYQQLGTKIGMNWLSVKDKLGSLDPAEAQALGEYASFRRKAFGTLNATIKNLTGAAMSEKEADRIRKSVPDPGNFVWTGDGPTEFQAKLDGAIAQVEKAIARQRYFLRAGVRRPTEAQFDRVPIEGIDRLVKNDKTGQKGYIIEGVFVPL